MKKVPVSIGVVLAVLTGIIFIRTLMFTPPDIQSQDAVTIEVDGSAVAEHLSQAVQFQTVSPLAPQRRDHKPFDDFLAWAETTYPEVHRLEKTIVKDHTLLFKWTGLKPDLKPILFAAHYDVVPVVPGTEESWEHPPFGGVIADGYVWGRGAMDDKAAMITILEATTILLRQGFTPERTVYFSFDHDEEIGGSEGAAGVTALLASQGVQLAWSLDEGGFVMEGVLPGLEQPLASIFIAEKGYLSLILTARGDSGHSSMPSQDTSIFLLAEALTRLRANKIPGKLEGVALETMEMVARHSTFVRRMFFANRWLFGSLIESELSKDNLSDSFLRTTTAPTMLSAGIKDNVLPGLATATVNFRIHPRDTAESVIARVEDIIGDDRIEVSRLREGLGSEPSGVSSTQSQGYATLSNVIRQMYSPVIVAPGILPAGTNSKHYAKIADDAYRFNLLRLGEGEMAGFHGTNERMRVDSLKEGTAAYVQMITVGSKK